LPPASKTMGELLVTGSSTAFQFSLPESLSSARRLPPVGSLKLPTNRINKLPSIKGDAWQENSCTASCFFQSTSPFASSRQNRWPFKPSVYSFPPLTIGVAVGRPSCPTVNAQSGYCTS